MQEEISAVLGRTDGGIEKALGWQSWIAVFWIRFGYESIVWKWMATILGFETRCHMFVLGRTMDGVLDNVVAFCNQGDWFYAMKNWVCSVQYLDFKDQMRSSGCSVLPDWYNMGGSCYYFSDVVVFTSLKQLDVLSTSAVGNIYCDYLQYSHTTHCILLTMM